MAIVLPSGHKIERIMESNLSDLNKQVVLSNKLEMRVRQYDLPSLNEELIPVINKAIYESGFGGSWSAEDFQVFYANVIEDIAKDWRHLTVREIKIAFNLGVREKYGEYHGMSVRLLNKFLRCYSDETKRKAFEALRNVPREQVKVSDDEKDAIHRDWLETIYRDWDVLMKSGEYVFNDFANTLYNYLEKIGLLNLSKDEKWKLFNKAKKQIESKSKSALTGKERKKFDEILEGIAKKSKSEMDTARTEAKHIAVREFILRCKKEGKDLKEMILNNDEKAKKQE